MCIRDRSKSVLEPAVIWLIQEDDKRLWVVILHSDEYRVSNEWLIVITFFFIILNRRSYVNNIVLLPENIGPTIRVIIFKLFVTIFYKIL